ncbi:TPA: phage tail sheath subtilisin-like domain-containing protein [Clostridioides difficile]|nr:phage tail sheath subtilisin-like domain-containing protein [Clostridioides difficile]HBG1040834.1 phage tail sheath subtilisin-like domain-containing protein [Clostridioides difficile]HCQ5573961.1 phage tail sheath subtilisin-like domain-containing protein [Clostridioides difficile]
MGLPEINISFIQAGKTFVKRSGGIVALILKDTKNIGLVEIKEMEDIPENYSATNLDYIKMAMKGNVYPPNKVLVYTLDTDESIDDALDFLETCEFNYLCMPDETEQDLLKIKTWIKKMREDNKIKVKAITASNSADYEGIINFTATDIEVEGKKYTSNEFLPRIAGFIAGTPSTQSVTYAEIPEVTNIPKLTRAEANTRINNGELILIKESGAIVIARGVTSFTTITDSKGDIFKKIKLVDTLDQIHNDIKKIIVKNYIGKTQNTYDNKCLLIVAIQLYLQELEKDGLIDEGSTVEINLDAQRAWLKKQNIDISNLEEQQIKEYNTDTLVFLKARIKLIDAMEDVYLDISM